MTRFHVQRIFTNTYWTFFFQVMKIVNEKKGSNQENQFSFKLLQIFTSQILLIGFKSFAVFIGCRVWLDLNKIKKKSICFLLAYKLDNLLALWAF